MFFNFFFDFIFHLITFLAIVFVMHTFYDYCKDNYTSKVNLHVITNDMKMKMNELEKEKEESDIIENDLNSFLETLGEENEIVEESEIVEN